ncbi:ROK family protein [Paenibacillus frigoriresistens]|uniref:ROK family protein n=1 Tax=Paenibacillus alginolyticus TaxID=59839 RepID=UPI001567680A|nr:ROK family protein [Paenibacillus frigoriresistens]NRF95914.1 ROK family protein [Paenibacillus frigoriresistens]
MQKVTIELLQAIRRKPISKAELVRLTKYSLAIVTEHTEILLEKNFVREIDRGPSTGGRKPLLLSFNAEAGYIVAIDLESTNVRVGITDLNCNILVSESLDDIDVLAGPTTVLEQVKELVFALLHRVGIESPQIKGIGMGVPGPVEYSVGLPASLSIMRGWDRYPIRQFWSQYFQCPCYVDNNVHTMAIGEQMLDLESKIENLLFLKIGNGIGAGIICKGQIYRGSTDCAGDVGHINMGHDILCYCGNRGCLEAFAGGRAIAARAEEMARNGQSEVLGEIYSKKKKLTLVDVRQAVEVADPVAVELMRECGVAIGNVLAGLVNFFNPSLILIGGGVSQVGDVLLASIRQAVYQRALPLSVRNLVIQYSSLGENAGIVGAAALTVDEIIDNNAFVYTDAH